MGYDELLKSKGWFKVACSKCSGSKKQKYLNLSKEGEEVEVLYTMGYFRYRKDRVLITQAHISHLQHQHFMQ